MNEDEGFYDKYNVQRTDGQDRQGGKHFNCRYFVLDISHDPHAVPALLAYAKACEIDRPNLSAQLIEMTIQPE